MNSIKLCKPYMLAALLGSGLFLIACEQDDASDQGTIIIVDDNGGGGIGGAAAIDGAGGQTVDGVGADNMLGGAGGAGGMADPMTGLGGNGGAGPSPDPGPGGNDVFDCVGADFSPGAERLDQNDDGVLLYLGYKREPTNDNPTTDVLLIELHPERGFPMQPGIYDLAEIGSDINTCQICVVQFHNLNFSARPATRDRLLFATSGQVEITAIGDLESPLRARLTGIELNEVNLSRGADEQLEAEFPEGGAVTCLDDYGIEVMRDIPPAMVGEPVRDFMLQNCQTEEFVSIEEIARNTGAIWFIGTAGWCGACRNLLLNGGPAGRPFDVMNEMGPERLRLLVVLGENQSHQQSTLRYCRQYASSYADDASNFYLDHSGSRAFAALFGHLNVYTASDGRFGLPWNGVVSGGDDPMVYRYSDRSGQPQTLSQILNELTAQPEGAPDDMADDMGGQDQP